MKRLKEYLKKITLKEIIIRIIVLVVIIIFCLFQNLHLVTSDYTYSSEKLPSSLDGFKIVQISDLHNASFGAGNSWLLEDIKEAEPDIIVITGDIVDGNHTNIDVALKFAAEAVKIAPTYYITGNHEYWLADDEREELLEGLAAAGVTDLDNKSVRISRGGDYFTLIGLDDNDLQNSTLKELTTEEDGLRVVLAHEPQYIEKYEKRGADLVLSGHAHGGQIRLPFIGGLVAPNQGFLPKYTAGEYQSGDMDMIVSRGLGNSIIPVRVFNYPEIVTVTLKSL